ncbi:mavicyanin-like [Apium graveolens]|uniref:mavicyanin-like n=1 Tax=Apium graveolens TaxID=4045 RepID=UPI003D7BA2CC
MELERLKMAVLLTVIIGGILHIQISDAQKQNRHIVGDSVDWTIPPDDNTYITWAASQKFAIGDTLVFNFESELHTVAEVTEAAYNECNSQNPISEWTKGPASVPLKSSGKHYYLCSVPGHCMAAQKLAINV